MDGCERSQTSKLGAWFHEAEKGAAHSAAEAHPRSAEHEKSRESATPQPQSRKFDKEGVTRLRVQHVQLIDDRPFETLLAYASIALLLFRAVKYLDETSKGLDLIPSGQRFAY